jgi:DNA-directed RNA polymerase subunit omega
MARITVEDCLQRIGDENRFSLIHLAIARVKQHRKGAPWVVRGKNKEVVMTLREIAAGKVTFDNIKALTPAVEKTLEAPEAELTATETATTTI